MTASVDADLDAEEDGPTTATDARALTRQRRERRADGVVTLPFGVPHVEVECPECGEAFQVTIATSDPAAYSPTFGRCSSWECEAFLKYRHTTDRKADAGGQQTLGRWSR